MIQAKELRIGNWVKIKHVYTKVWSLDGEGINLISKYNRYANQDYVAPRFYYKDIQPIPLTEDWLLKFGFKNKPSPCVWFIFKEDSTGKANKSLFLEGDGDCFSIIGWADTEIKFVHQLQNHFYFNTGTELEIKNA